VTPCETLMKINIFKFLRLNLEEHWTNDELERRKWWKR